jgi:hypothetical protein
MTLRRTAQAKYGPVVSGPMGASITPELEGWLLTESDPSVRYRYLTDVAGRTASDPSASAALEEIGRDGWAARILAEQLPSGAWDSAQLDAPHLYRPKYIATNWRLIVLSDLGLTRAHPGVARAVDLVFASQDRPNDELGGAESEICFTGNAVRYLTRLGYGDDPRVRRAAEWLVAAQKPDGGWHCFPSETGTLDGWEPLAAFAVIPEHERPPAMRSAIARGAAFYLDRGLLREGDPYEPWARLHYPTHYYYDLLVGLDTLTRLGYGHDHRMGPALDLLESKRDAAGRWSIDAVHPDLTEAAGYAARTPIYPFQLEMPGAPSRWITMTALAVLVRAGRVPRPAASQP